MGWGSRGYYTARDDHSETDSLSERDDEDSDGYEAPTQYIKKIRKLEKKIKKLSKEPAVGNTNTNTSTRSAPKEACDHLFMSI